MEHYIVCNSCGKGFTYTSEDVSKNTGQAFVNVLSSLGQVAGAVSGNYVGTMANKMYEKDLKDFSRCPYCNSHDLKEVDQEEFQRSQRKLSGGTVVNINANASSEMLIKRTKLLMEDRDWNKAEAYCDQILDVDPENGEVYFLLALIEAKAESEEALLAKKADLRTSRHYNNIMRFGDEALKEKVKGLCTALDSRIEEERRLREEQAALAREQELERQYQFALMQMDTEDIAILRQAYSDLSALGTYKDAAGYAETCRTRIADLEAAKAKLAKNAVKFAIFAILSGVVGLMAGVLNLPTGLAFDALAIFFLTRYRKNAMKNSVRTILTVVVILIVCFAVLVGIISRF